MKHPCTRLHGPAALVASLCAAASLQAAILSFQSVDPTPGPNDIYNFVGAPRDGQNAGDGTAFADGAANDAFTYVSMYAGLASVMIALVFLYVCACIFILGGELNSAIVKARERG